MKKLKKGDLLDWIFDFCLSGGKIARMATRTYAPKNKWNNLTTHSPTRFLNSILKFLFGLLFKTNTKQIIDNDGRWIRSAGFRSLGSKTRCPYPPPTIIDYLSTLMNYYDNSYEQQDNWLMYQKQKFKDS